jgi:glutaredoxin-like protein
VRLISEKDAGILRRRFAELAGPVKLVMFTQSESGLSVPGQECAYCRETRMLVEDLGEVSDGRIGVEIYDFLLDKEQVARYGITRIPAVAVVGDRDYGIRYYGIPAGYEFASVVEDILDVSAQRSGLRPETAAALRGLPRDVHIQVFVTPTCPYCPRAARLAHKMALESDRVRADVVEVSEFPHLAQRYHVFGVPKVVINERVQFEGAVPEKVFLSYVLQAAGVEEA